jgi:hypothetical protein
MLWPIMRVILADTNVPNKACQEAIHHQYASLLCGFGLIDQIKPAAALLIQNAWIL